MPFARCNCTRAPCWFLSAIAHAASPPPFPRPPQVLGAVHLSFLTRQEKLKLAFEHLDLDGNGELDMEELQARGRGAVEAAVKGSGTGGILMALSVDDLGSGQACEPRLSPSFSASEERAYSPARPALGILTRPVPPWPARSARPPQVFAKSLNPRDDDASASRKANRSLAWLDENQSGQARGAARFVRCFLRAPLRSLRNEGRERMQ